MHDDRMTFLLQGVSIKQALIRGSIAIALLILIFMHPSEARGQGHVPQPFHFEEIRLHRRERVASRVLLHKGTLIQPFSQAGGGHPYQPVVLCHDVEVLFGADGLSDLVEIEGFCYAPGLTPATDTFEWRITHWIDQKVAAANDCNRALRIEIRTGQADLRLPFSGKVIDDCDDLLPACREQFDSTTRNKFDGKDLRDLERVKACGVTMEEKWILRCDPSRARAMHTRS